jgi:3-mercaptopyruvate sulfurtransferase SseA
VAQFLREQGYEAFALKGGYQGWRDAGYPLEPKEVEMATTIEDICPDCGKPMGDHVGGEMRSSE